MPYSFEVSEPTPNHEHWGIKLRVEGRVIPGECLPLEAGILEASRDLGVFHQGGSHRDDEECRGYHYFEMWALGPAVEDGRAQVEAVIEKVRPTVPRRVLTRADFDRTGRRISH